MSKDFKRENRTSTSSCIAKTLKSIDSFLQSMGKNLDHYDLPPLPVEVTDSAATYPKEIRDEISIEIPHDDYSAEINLNLEQEVSFQTILSRINEGIPRVFFVDGPGGTGKTYLYRALLAHRSSRGKIALATATSRVAAPIMPGGRTAHSHFKIPIISNETSTCNIPVQSGNAKLIRKASLIIWDEAPMAKHWAIETLDRSMKDIINSTEPFGGKVIVFGGDFRQVLLVVPKGTIQQTIDASLVKSYLWTYMEKLSLSRNMRARTDPIFSDFLLRVRSGDEPMDDEGNIELPNEMVIKYDDDDDKSEDRLINAIFPSLQENPSSAEYITSRAILATTNEYVDKLNEKLISCFPGKAKTLVNFDEAVDDTQLLPRRIFEFVDTKWLASV
ncbi:hypothetical protein ACH5RR_033624 [Cinchona calisaya]|uniref:ATP-dependent DNA helicase n=1 Tax=Cinchona calisaya TaxID=153742 RepID=A0ABD2Y9U9_9GENT